MSVHRTTSVIRDDTIVTTIGAVGRLLTR